MARMKYRIVLAPEAIQDVKRLPARDRGHVRDAIEEHLRLQPTRVSKSRIKRLRGLAKPQYRLRVRDIRIFYDVSKDEVRILAISWKPEAERWLAEKGERS
jgi:mRNA-degrading endonuclease RelE of RelBE toxin-antitoxin system